MRGLLHATTRADDKGCHRFQHIEYTYLHITYLYNPVSSRTSLSLRLTRQRLTPTPRTSRKKKQNTTTFKKRGGITSQHSPLEHAV